MRFDNFSRLILLRSAFVAQKALLSCPIYSGAVSCPRTLCLPLSVCHPHTLPSNDRIWRNLRVTRKYACLLAGPLSSAALQLWLPRRKNSRCLDCCTPCSIHRAQRGACPANSSFSPQEIACREPVVLVAAVAQTIDCTLEECLYPVALLVGYALDSFYSFRRL